mgnify:CR=1 FL=1
MVYSKLAHYLLSVSLCKDLASLVEQYKLIRNEYDLAGWEEDKNCLVAEDPYHQAYMKALASVMDMIEIRVEKLGGQHLLEYGA